MKISDEVRQSLDISNVLKLISAGTRSDLGRKALEKIEPAADMPSLISRQNLLAAYLNFSDNGGLFPWDDAVQIVSDDLNEARHTALMLGDELLKVRILLALAKAVRLKALEVREKYPALSWFSNRIRDFDAELDKLSVLNSDGSLADSASQKLREIREELLQKRNDARRVGTAMLSGNISSMLQERVLSLRNGRYSVLVKQSCVGRFPGIVSDKSASGNSVYMEPHSLVPLNNRIAALAEMQRQEERRIYGELTQMLLQRENAINEAESALAQLDVFYCMNDLISFKHWQLPELIKRSEFCFYGLHHPLLGDKGVPIDVYCGKDFRALVITGPNTGGKTVALKTTALAVFLAWCGLPVPAADGSAVGLISAIYADIGDEQSIEQSLSTFSSHLKRIVAMLKSADSDSLVLLDELGAGTDPQEGAALGIAILEELIRRRTLVLATTHHNPIKRFATTTPGVEAACVDFDMKTLSPTYHLLVGIPGQSNALAIARRYGMPAAIVDQAEKHLNSGELNVEKLMGQLQEKRAAIEKLSRELALEKQQIDAEKKKLQDTSSAAEQKRDQMLINAERESQKVLDDAEAKARTLLKSLKGAAKSAGHREMAKQKQQLDRSRDRSLGRQTAIENRQMPVKTPAFAVGANVKLRDSAVKGEIVSIEGKNAVIQSGAMHVTVPLSKLVPTSAPAPLKSADEISIIKRPEGVPSSIMIRGMLADEALPLVERYLDRAMRAGYGEVTVIHGHGEGILRRLVHKLCDRLPYVESYRLGDRGEGGWGVTIVKFK
jgi:DNA mismatch repair protein MutS2